ncbi:fluoride efflux transporter CrcB [Bacillus tianshenii]|uniref:fluoride efflux transporter CrcB n=1 Tax=Sutcliffiella tianshenii TaxID=1463404 RepID=UPI001CD3DD4B|nr:fluoride efflux transporter CrcB [Bacillus tianshenii]MCA1321429.1 fluoride efflux transporter CrcB [Bacillus tianshenii]
MMHEGMLQLMVALGGGTGAVTRYLTGKIIMRRYPSPRIPVAMLTVNIAGSIGLGLLMGHLHEEPELYGNLPFLLVGIGFLGAFTTFSTFSMEAVQLLREGSVKRAALYILLSVIGAMIGFILGFGLMSL